MGTVISRDTSYAATASLASQTTIQTRYTTIQLAQPTQTTVVSVARKQAIGGDTWQGEAATWQGEIVKW